MSKKVGQKIITSQNELIDQSGVLKDFLSDVQGTIISLSIYATPGTRFGINYSNVQEVNEPAEGDVDDSIEEEIEEPTAGEGEGNGSIEGEVNISFKADSEITIGNLGVFQISDTNISNLCILTAPGLSTNDNISHFITIDYVYEESEAVQQ